MIITVNANSKINYKEKPWGNWIIGTAETNGTILDFWLKGFEEPSRYGIDNGKISKLMLKQNGKIVYNFDRGLDVATQTAESKTVLAMLKEHFN